MNLMKVVLLVLSVSLLTLCFGADGCDSVEKAEQTKVQSQQKIYLENQPPPAFDWSLQRSLWIQYYEAQSKKTTTMWYYEMNMGNLDPIFSGICMGIPLPADTQLTTPSQTLVYSQGVAVVEQAEPNGLFTSKNTDSTIVMDISPDGSISPVYCEGKVYATPFPSRWDYTRHCIVRVEGKSTVVLSAEKPTK